MAIGIGPSLGFVSRFGRSQRRRGQGPSPTNRTLSTGMATGLGRRLMSAPGLMAPTPNIARAMVPPPMAPVEPTDGFQAPDMGGLWAGPSSEVLMKRRFGPRSGMNTGITGGMGEGVFNRFRQLAGLGNQLAGMGRPLY